MLSMICPASSILQLFHFAQNDFGGTVEPLPQRGTGYVLQYILKVRYSSKDGIVHLHGGQGLKFERAASLNNEVTSSCANLSLVTELLETTLLLPFLVISSRLMRLEEAEVVDAGGCEP
jgi:hypothetical protein